MKKQTLIPISKLNNELIDYQIVDSKNKAKIVQDQLDPGDILAIELQKCFGGAELFSTTPIRFHSKTMKNIQSNIEPYFNLYTLLDKVNNDGFRHSCPICKSPEKVILNGRTQRLCKITHENKQNKSGVQYFSSSTSFEAHQVVKILANFVSEQLYGNSTHSFINQLLGISRYFIEFICSFLAENLPMKSISDINLTEGNTDFIVIFSDFSGSRLSKKISILVAEINNELVWYIYRSPNSVVADVLTRDIAKVIEEQGFKGQVIMITDGEYGWLDPIRDNFSNVIHIRQFHKKSLLGTVFVHFMHNKKEHTLKCRWDLVKEKIIDEKTLNFVDIPDEGISKSTKSKRILREKRRSQIDPKDQSIDSNSENPYQITLYEGRVMTSRGKRNIKKVKQSNTVNTPTGDDIQPKVEKLNSDGKYEQIPNKSKSSSTRKGTDNKLEYKNKILFKGNIDDCIKEYSWLQPIYQVLVIIFGGLFITSNRAENPFGIKHKLGHHGTMKTGFRYLKLRIAMNSFSNLDKFRGWLNKKLDLNSLLFYEIQRDKLTTIKNRNKKELLLHLQVGKYLVIDYEDAEGHRTIRVIKILEQMDDKGVFKSYCFLRSDERNFKFNRIINFSHLDECHKYLFGINRF